MPRLRKANQAFSLAELLIALGILGVLAAFTIPKVFNMQGQSEAYNAAGNSAAYAILAAYSNVKAQGALTASTKTADLTPYLNYVAVKTVGVVDNVYSFGGTQTCQSPNSCLRMPSGGCLLYHTTLAFGGTTTTNNLSFIYDPDCQSLDSTGDGPGKANNFILYYDGKLKDRSSAYAQNCHSVSCPFAAIPGTRPPWFSW